MTEPLLSRQHSFELFAWTSIIVPHFIFFHPVNSLIIKEKDFAVPYLSNFSVIFNQSVPEVYSKCKVRQSRSACRRFLATYFRRKTSHTFSYSSTLSSGIDHHWIVQCILSRVYPLVHENKQTVNIKASDLDMYMLHDQYIGQAPQTER